MEHILSTILHLARDNFAQISSKWQLRTDKVRPALDENNFFHRRYRILYMISRSLHLIQSLFPPSRICWAWKVQFELRFNYMDFPCITEEPLH